MRPLAHQLHAKRGGPGREVGGEGDQRAQAGGRLEEADAPPVDVRVGHGVDGPLRAQPRDDQAARMGRADLRRDRVAADLAHDLLRGEGSGGEQEGDEQQDGRREWTPHRFPMVPPSRGTPGPGPRGAPSPRPAAPCAGRAAAGPSATRRQDRGPARAQRGGQAVRAERGMGHGQERGLHLDRGRRAAAHRGGAVHDRRPRAGVAPGAARPPWPPPAREPRRRTRPASSARARGRGAARLVVGQHRVQRGHGHLVHAQRAVERVAAHGVDRPRAGPRPARPAARRGACRR